MHQGVDGSVGIKEGCVARRECCKTVSAAGIVEVLSSLGVDLPCL